MQQAQALVLAVGAQQVDVAQRVVELRQGLTRTVEDQQGLADAGVLKACRSGLPRGEGSGQPGLGVGQEGLGLVPHGRFLRHSSTMSQPAASAPGPSTAPPLRRVCRRSEAL